MSANRYPADSREGVALELFMEIRRVEEKDEQERGNNAPARARLLDLYAECLMAARGQRDHSAVLHRWPRSSN
jgi:hypothetical protein